MTTTRQIAMDFTPGLTDQFRSLREVCVAVVYSSRKGLAGVAADNDMSPSTLTKILNEQGDPDNKRNPPWELVEGIIRSTGDLRPIYYLAEKFCEDPAVKRERALAQIPTLVEALQRVLADAGQKPRARR